MTSPIISVCTPADLPTTTQVIALYDAVGWRTYTRTPDTLMAGLRGSLRVVVAHMNGELVGLARVVDDGATICYLQDVLVHPNARRQGVGRQLVQQAFAPYASVRQHVLITDEESGQKKFYESLGFAQLGQTQEGRAFVRFAP